MTIQNELILNQANWAARDQGLRPTCIAFALSELNLSSTNNVQVLSAEYLYQGAALCTPAWMPNVGVPLGSALAAANNGQPADSDYPYQQVEPTCPIPTLPSTLKLHGNKIQLPAVADTTKIIKALRKSCPVGLCLKLTNSFYAPVNGIVADEHLSLKDVLHAVAIVGLGWINTSPYFLIRNSWGADWGHAGNAWISGDYITMHSICVMEV